MESYLSRMSHDLPHHGMKSSGLAAPSSPDSYGEYGNTSGDLPMAGISMLPRSASEAVFDSGNKYRQLPCRTFISVGTCPYRERCVYLHDPRCICRDAKTKTRRKNKDDVVLDSMFWPIMSYNSVAVKLDNNRQPHVIQPYNVPPAQNDQFRRHDEAVYSMWMHFVDFCLANSESAHVPYADMAPCFAAPDLPMNAYTKLPRLPVFRVLSGSNGLDIPRDEFMAAELVSGESNGVDFAAKAALRRMQPHSYSTDLSFGDFDHPTSLSQRVSLTDSDGGNSLFTGNNSRRSSFNHEKEMAGFEGKAETADSVAYRFSPDAISQLWKQSKVAQKEASSHPVASHFMSLSHQLLA